MSSCSVMPSRMDSSILLATSVLLGRDLSGRSLQIFQPWSQIWFFMSEMALRSLPSSPCFMMLRHSSSASIAYSFCITLRSSALVTSQRHSAMMAPAKWLPAKASFSFLSSSASSSATRASFSLQVSSNLLKSASVTTAKAQNWRVQSSSFGSWRARQRSRTRLPTVSSRARLGTIMKSTVLRWAGFHLMQPLLVVASRQGFSSWLKMIPSFSCGRHFTYFFSRNSTMLNFPQVSRKKSFTRTSIRCTPTPSISLQRRKLAAHSNLSLNFKPQILRPRCTSASKTRQRIWPLDSRINSPSSTSTTAWPSGPTSVDAASSRWERPISAAQATSLPVPWRLTRQNSVQGASSPGITSLESCAQVTLATMSRQRTPSVFSQSRQGDCLLLLRVLKMSLQDCLVMEAGWPPKKGSRRLPSNSIRYSCFTVAQVSSVRLPGRSTVMKAELHCGRPSSSSQLQNIYYIASIGRICLTFDCREASTTLPTLQGEEGLQSMEFFNKYKDLFEVPQGLSVPHSRLRLDNELFVERVYQGTTQQEYSLSSKLRELKKDYSSFEQQIGELATFKKTPARSLSRKGKEPQPVPATVAQRNNENQDRTRENLHQQRQRAAKEALRREEWLQDERRDILKHSQLDHIFNNKLNKIYDLDDIKPATLPRPQHPDGPLAEMQAKRGNFQIKHRNRRNTEGKSPSQERKAPSMENALSRREKAKGTLQFRRKKLQQLLRSLW